MPRQRPCPAAAPSGGDADRPAPWPPQKSELKPERIADQKSLDASISAACKGNMAKYLKARFSLSKRDVPHRMKF